MLGQQLHHVPVPSLGGQQQGRLLLFVEGRAGIFVACQEEKEADVSVAEQGGKVQVGVGEAGGGSVGVVEQKWTGRQDPLDKESITGVDGPTNANGSLDPGGLFGQRSSQGKGGRHKEKEDKSHRERTWPRLVNTS